MKFPNFKMLKKKFAKNFQIWLYRNIFSISSFQIVGKNSVTNFQNVKKIFFSVSNFQLSLKKFQNCKEISKFQNCKEISKFQNCKEISKFQNCKEISKFQNCKEISKFKNCKKNSVTNFQNVIIFFCQQFPTYIVKKFRNLKIVQKKSYQKLPKFIIKIFWFFAYNLFKI